MLGYALPLPILLAAYEAEYGMTTKEFLARWHCREFMEDGEGLDLLPFEEWARLAEQHMEGWQ
jgi:hypothetical protein